MIKLHTTLMAIGVLVAIAPRASAADREGAYVVGGVNTHRITLKAQDVEGSKRRTSYTVGGGVRLSPNIALEGDYYGQLGNTRVGGIGAFSSRTIGGSVLGILPLGPVDVYGRLGAGYQQNRFGGANAVTTSSSQNRAVVQYGVGADYAIGDSMFLRTEWTGWAGKGSLRGGRADGLSVNPAQISLGFGYRF